MIDFFIVGAQKSASTYIHRLLMQHPDVEMPVEEIPLLEDPDYQVYLQSNFSGLFHTEGGIKGVKRPVMFHLDYVPLRIMKHFPNSKIIISLRNPVDRAISAYYHYMRYGFLPVEDINTGFINLFDQSFLDEHKRACEILSFSKYSDQLESYFSVFDKGQVHVSIMDDIVHDKDDFSKTLFDFLNISFVDISLYKSNRGRYSLLRLRYLQKVNPFLYRYNEDCTRLYKKEMSLTSSFGYLLLGLDKFILSRFAGDSPPAVNKSLMSRLRDYFDEDIRKCSHILGRQLPW